MLEGKEGTKKTNENSTVIRKQVTCALYLGLPNDIDLQYNGLKS